MIVDHIGYAVKDIEKARPVFESLGYSFEPSVEDDDRNLLIQFGNNKAARVELLQTLKEGEDSPVCALLKKNGPTPYHICYKTENLEKTIALLVKDKWIVIQKPAKAIAFAEDGGVSVCFLYHSQVGVIELVER